MTEERKEYLTNLINDNPNDSNKTLAKYAVSEDGDSPYYGYSAGSVANYLGKVKRELADVSIDDVKSEEDLEIVSASMEDNTDIKIFEDSVNPRNQGLLNLCNRYLNNPNNYALPDLPFVISIPTEDLEGIQNELFGYGYRFEVVPNEPVNDVDTASNFNIAVTSSPINEEERVQLVNCICLSVELPLYGEEWDSIYEGVPYATEDSPMVLSFTEESDADKFLESVVHLTLNLDRAVEDTKEKVASITAQPVSLNPAGEFSPQAESSAQPPLDPHKDYLVVGVKDEAFKADYFKYINALDDGCSNKVMVFGNEPRFAAFSNGYIDAAYGGIGSGGITGGKGLKEEYALYDAISATIADALRTTANPANENVNITIITESGLDWGSVHNNREDVMDLISKVKSRFGWNVAIAVREGSAADVAVSLGIDSSNAINYAYTTDLNDMLSEARTRANEALRQGQHSPVNYF